MNRISNRKAKRAAWCGVLGVLLGGAAITWAADGGARLILNGKVASTGVKTINSKAYVPLADVAKSLDMTVVKVPGGYEIKKAGGATPISGLRGKVGDVLFDGKWRFQVLSVDTVDSYQLKNKSTTDYAVYNSVAEMDD